MMFKGGHSLQAASMLILLACVCVCVYITLDEQFIQASTWDAWWLKWGGW